MKQIAAYILLTVFIGFLLSISTNFRMYMKVINAGAAVEDVNSMPEEHNEKHTDTNFKNHFATSELRLSAFFDAAGKYYELHQFSLVENIYFDVPYSPPELG